MSSEPPGHAASSWKPGSFRWLASTTIVILVVAAAGLTVANAKQGPRVVGAEVNAAATVQRVAQRLLLRVNQPVAVIADQVVVTPTVPIEVSTDRSTVVLRFSGTLSYATTYQIQVPVRSTATGATATLRHVLRTPEAQLYVLQRSGTGPSLGSEDHIIRTVVGSGERQVVYQAPRIQAFAVAEPLMVVNTQDGDDAGRLTVGPVDGSEGPKTIADQGLFTQLRSSGPGGMFGFVRSPRGFEASGESQLEFYDPATGEVTRAKGLAGGALAVQDWAFIPGARSIVVQADDSSVYLIDPASNAAPVPLGGHDRLHGFADGGSTLIVQDAERYTALNLRTGEPSAIPSFALPKYVTLDALLAAPEGRGYIGMAVRTSEVDLQYSVVRLVEGRPRPLYAPDLAATWIDKICLSPNSEYLAVQTIPDSTETDDYMPLPGFRQMSTVVIDLDTGDVSDDIPGFGSTWCT